jgi:hypothetical protein
MVGLLIRHQPSWAAQLRIPLFRVQAGVQGVRRRGLLSQGTDIEDFVEHKIAVTRHKH